MQNIMLSATEGESASIPDIEEAHHNINKLAWIEHYFKYFLGINSFNTQFPALSTTIAIPFEDITEVV